MKKMTFALPLGLIVLLAFSSAQAQIPKEFSGTGINAFSGTFKTVAMGQERVQMTYEVLGASISDTGEGVHHNTSLRCVGSIHAIKGVYEGGNNGFCVQTRPDGDQIFMTTKSSGTLGRGSKGTYTLVGGTGKMTGIQGGGEFTEFVLRPAAEGTFQGYNRVKGQYKLP
jgi:hypothetical protein